MSEDRKDRRRERHEPGHDGKESEPHHEREPESGVERTVLLRGGKFFGKDGDEYEIVDAEDDLQNDESDQSRPEGGIKKKIHGSQKKKHPTGMCGKSEGSKLSVRRRKEAPSFLLDCSQIPSLGRVRRPFWVGSEARLPGAP